MKDSKAAMISGDYKLKTGVVGKVYGLALSQDYTFDSYVRSIEARGEVPVSWDVEGLPEGMYFEKDEENPLRILLKGIPRSAGEYPVRVLLSKNIGTANSPNIFTDSRDYTLSIIDNQPASFTAIGSFPQYFNKGTFSYNVIPLLGTPPLSVSYRGTLPDGLSFNKYTNSFILSGVAEKTGTFSINITVSNDTVIASKDVTITVLDPAVITTYYLPDGLKGEKYHAALSTLYDVPAIWTVKGTLPGGLTFSASGDIDGTPAAALPDGKQNTEYPLTFINMTGTNPVSLSFVDGKIPDGLMLA